METYMQEMLNWNYVWGRCKTNLCLFVRVCQSSAVSECEWVICRPPTCLHYMYVCVLPSNDSLWNPTNHNWPLYDNIQLLEGRTPPPHLADFKLSDGRNSPSGTDGMKRQAGEVKTKTVVRERFVVVWLKGQRQLVQTSNQCMLSTSILCE